MFSLVDASCHSEYSALGFLGCYMNFVYVVKSLLSLLVILHVNQVLHIDCEYVTDLLQAPRPSTGPHKMRECLPLVVFLRNRLKYALTYDEVKKIVNQRLIKVDGKVRTDKTYPAGFMGEYQYEP